LRLTGFDTKSFSDTLLNFERLKKKNLHYQQKVDTTNAEGGITVVKKAIGNWKSIGPYF
jgi:hypothetical protein